MFILDGSSTPFTTLTTNAFASGSVGLYDFSPIGGGPGSLRGQTFDNFQVSETTFEPKQSKGAGEAQSVDHTMPDLPSPQDWVLVLEKIEGKDI